MNDVPIEVWRILDAAANRAGEGLRVVEEFSRFGLNDAHLSRKLKELRHDLTSVLAAIPEENRLSARDTIGDVGTSIGTASEYHRGSPLDVVRASFKRTQEALRTLEEYGKLVDLPSERHRVSVPVPQTFAQRIEQLRYGLYTLEKAILRTRSAAERLQGANLYFLVTADLCATGFEATVQAALKAGVRIIQLREKNLTDRVWIDRARTIRRWTSETQALLIINDRPDLAALVDADGVHLGQEDMSVAEARQILGPHRLIGVSTHTIDQARQAVLDGADYLGVGPTFSSGTKSFDQFAGLEFIHQVATEISLPWFAIGGINLGNLKEARTAGAARVAVSGAICRSTDPFRASADLLAALSECVAESSRPIPAE